MTLIKTWRRARERRKGSWGGERMVEEPQDQSGSRPKRRRVVRASEIREERVRRGVRALLLLLALLF